jgi:hypothetical protein
MGIIHEKTLEKILVNKKLFVITSSIAYNSRNILI